MHNKKCAEVHRTSPARRAAGRGTRKGIAGVLKAVLRILVSALVFSSLNYFATQCHIHGLEGQPWLQGVLVAIVEKTLRHYESRVTR